PVLLSNSSSNPGCILSEVIICKYGTIVLPDRLFCTFGSLATKFVNMFSGYMPLWHFQEILNIITGCL
ncbi:MAG: hypothetical protein AAB221_09890, partial [Bacteroidota bacterium]